HGGNTGSSPVRVTFHFNISTWSRGVAVNMPACHAGDRGFNSRRDRPESLQHTKSWGFFVVPSWIKIVKSDTFIMDNYEKRDSEAKRGKEMAKKIVVVDDERPIADILEFNLEKEGYEVHCAYDGNDALELILEVVPDIVLLDIMLPGMDGMEVCREFRKKHEMPIIMLTAKDPEFHQV